MSENVRRWKVNQRATDQMHKRKIDTTDVSPPFSRFLRYVGFFGDWSR